MRFKQGDILQVAVASRSHVDKPYYVIVLSDNGNELVTDIPGAFTRRWVRGNETWFNYHAPRLKKIGISETHLHLLYNQELKVDGKTIYSADNPSKREYGEITTTIE